MMIGSVFAFFAIWTLYDRLRDTIPALVHCGVCGTRLRNLQVIHNLGPNRSQTYPFRLVDGTREEQPVRALCHRCERRAKQYRAHAELDEAGEPPVPAVPQRAGSHR
jgi:bacterioferritin-associated ferredoxin